MVQLLNKNERREIMNKIMHSIGKIEELSSFGINDAYGNSNTGKIHAFTSYLTTLVEILIEDNECRVNKKHLIDHVNKELEEQEKEENGS